jgi:uncharacterized protein YuzE
LRFPPDTLLLLLVVLEIAPRFRNQLSPERPRVSTAAGLSILLDMRVTYDAETDAAYVYLTDEALPPGRDSVPCDLHEGVQHAFVVMDWRDGRIVGLEVLDASKVLHRDLLDSAEKAGG